MKHPYIPTGCDQQGRRAVARHTPRTLSQCTFDAPHSQAIASGFAELQAKRVRRGGMVADLVIAALLVLCIGLVFADIIPLLR